MSPSLLGEMLGVSRKHARGGMKNVRWYESRRAYKGDGVKNSGSRCGGVVFTNSWHTIHSKLEELIPVLLFQAVPKHRNGRPYRRFCPRVKSQGEYNLCRGYCLGIPIFPRRLWYNSSGREDVA